MISKDKTHARWYPTDTLDTMYDVDDVRVGSDGLTIEMAPDGENRDGCKRIRLVWDGFVSYQVSAETYRDDCWVESKNDAWSFFVSGDSQYLQNFKDSCALFPDGARHFLIVGTNIIADVIAVDYPTATEY